MPLVWVDLEMTGEGKIMYVSFTLLLFVVKIMYVPIMVSFYSPKLDF